MSPSAPKSPMNYWKWTTKQKSSPHRPMQSKQAAIWIKVGKGCHIYARTWPRPLRSTWAENITNAWLPYINIWDNFKGP